MTDQQESVAGPDGHSLLTAFPLKCGSTGRGPMERGGGRESVADSFRHSLTAKGGNEGCWSGCLVRSTAENQTDRRASTAFFIGLDISTDVGTGHHRPDSLSSACIYCIARIECDTADTYRYASAGIEMKSFL